RGGGRGGHRTMQRDDLTERGESDDGQTARTRDEGAGGVLRRRRGLAARPARRRAPRERAAACRVRRRPACCGAGANGRRESDVSDIVLTREFRPHRRAPYAGQVASCGCWWSGIDGEHRRGELCESRLTGPRCTRTDGCNRPAGHGGDCEFGSAPFESPPTWWRSGRTPDDAA